PLLMFLETQRFPHHPSMIIFVLHGKSTSDWQMEPRASAYISSARRGMDKDTGPPISVGVWTCIWLCSVDVHLAMQCGRASGYAVWTCIWLCSVDVHLAMQSQLSVRLQQKPEIIRDPIQSPATCTDTLCPVVKHTVELF
ncbi:mCG145265, partial [Mus musculus]